MYSFELVGKRDERPFEKNGVAVHGHFRIADSANNAIAFCYLRENAELIVSALNAKPATASAELSEVRP